MLVETEEAIRASDDGNPPALVGGQENTYFFVHSVSVACHSEVSNGSKRTLDVASGLVLHGQRERATIWTRRATGGLAFAYQFLRVRNPLDLPTRRLIRSTD